MVLIVDDDEAFRHGLAENLRDDGHRVVEYGSPEEMPALETLPQPRLLITDYQMRGEDGLRLARRFHRAHPEVPVIIVTAHWSEHLDAAVSNSPFLNVHRKPVEYGAFHEVVHQLAGKPQS
jgi:DNA-binding NtrC family response regulator